MEFITLFTKNFSEIRKLQQAEKVMYNLVKKEDNSVNSYGIQIKSISNDTENIFILETISSLKDLVCNLITYLYENAVKPETAKDVIEDLKLLDLS